MSGERPSRGYRESDAYPARMSGGRGRGGTGGRAFVLFGGFLGGTVAGGWLGLVTAFVSGLAASEPPRFPGEDLLAAVLAVGVLAALCAPVYRQVLDKVGRIAHREIVQE